MLRDFLHTFAHWRIIHVMGMSSLRGRYARSKLGQVWLTLANAVFIIATGLVWSLIWGMTIDEYLPYVGVGHIIYLFIATCINESTGILPADARIYVCEKHPFALSTLAHIYRHFIIFIHNVPILIGLVWWSNEAHFTLDWRIIPALVLSLAFLIFSSYGLSLICSRFRDLAQMVGIFMQISFLLTPVMWRMDVLPTEYQHYVFINPFSSVLAVLRNPIIGLPVHNFAYVGILVWAALTFYLAYLAHRTYGRKIIFWL